MARRQLNFRKPVKIYVRDEKSDEREKKKWMKQHEIKKLPPGWSRYGYEPV